MGQGEDSHLRGAIDRTYLKTLELRRANYRTLLKTLELLPDHVYRDTLERLPDHVSLSLQYFRRLGAIPNIRNPRKFTEKIQHRKLYGSTDRMSELTDKIAVKDFVAARLGKDWVIPTLWHGDRLPPRSERRWPIPYVIKANHGSTWNYFVRTPEEENWDEIEHQTDRWLRSLWGQHLKEYLYRKIRPRLLVEPFIGDPKTLPIDYKFWAFGGRVEFIRVNMGRGGGQMTRASYNRQWRLQPFNIGAPLEERREAPPPSSLLEMIDAAERLAEEFDFVRVDLYEIGDKPLFGEMTFLPGSGFNQVYPKEYDMILGSKWPMD